MLTTQEKSIAKLAGAGSLNLKFNISHFHVDTFVNYAAKRRKMHMCVKSGWRLFEFSLTVIRLLIAWKESWKGMRDIHMQRGSFLEIIMSRIRISQMYAMHTLLTVISKGMLLYYWITYSVILMLYRETGLWNMQSSKPGWRFYRKIKGKHQFVKWVKYLRFR